MTQRRSVTDTASSIRIRGGATPAHRHTGALGAFFVLLAMSVLAACQDNGVRPPVTGAAADSADQILNKLAHYVTDAGLKRSLVEADTAYMYDPTQTAELRKLKVTFYDDNGAETSVLTANEGTYHWQNGAMDARGNVVGTAPDGRTLHTSALRYDPFAKKVSTDQHFTFDRGGDHLEGAGFTSDVDFTNIVVAQPRGVQAGPQLLPGQ